MPVEHIIFDCDGVLVESERVSLDVNRRLLADLGWHMTTEEIIERFVGQTHEHFVQEVFRNTGHALPEDWVEQTTPIYQTAYERHLTSVPGVVEAIDAIELPRAVATNGRHDSTTFKLVLTGLYERFRNRVFSATDVNNGKPAPDVYLHAAATMGWHPSTCVVVEDSVAGITSGLAAGMKVIGYAGGVSGRARIERPEVVIIDHMRDLPGAIESLSSRRR